MRSFVRLTNQPVNSFLCDATDRNRRFANTGKAQETVPKAVLFGLYRLFNKPVLGHRDQQPSRRGFVEACHAGKLTQPKFPVL